MLVKWPHILYKLQLKKRQRRLKLKTAFEKLNINMDQYCSDQYQEQH